MYVPVLVQCLHYSQYVHLVPIDLQVSFFNKSIITFNWLQMWPSSSVYTHVYTRTHHTPGHSQFFHVATLKNGVATLKNWEWPGDEAMCIHCTHMGTHACAHCLHHYHTVLHQFCYFLCLPRFTRVWMILAREALKTA